MSVQAGVKWLFEPLKSNTQEINSLNPDSKSFDLLLARLKSISLKGPIRSIGYGAPSVGMTLLSELGISYSSRNKPNFSGIVVTASRRISGNNNRVNLFAKVPDWPISACKSSREIANRHGYKHTNGSQRLYCTLSSKRPNSQGLFLEIDDRTDSLKERKSTSTGILDVAAWKLSSLKKKLIQSHPESVWVQAKVTKRNDVEYFHYRQATHTGPPRIDLFTDLLRNGTVTVDHLIENSQSESREKGPLFKISPMNFSALFPEPLKYDLM